MCRAEYRARREAREAALGPRYRPARPGPCVYCGGEATGVDHVPPLKIAERLIDFERVPHYLVSCCTLCNHLLNAFDDVRFSHRVAFLVARRVGRCAMRLRRGRVVFPEALAHRARLLKRWKVVRVEISRRGGDPDGMLMLYSAGVRDIIRLVSAGPAVG